MSSPIITITEGVKVNNRNKMKIGLGYVVKSNVGDFENITREVRIRIIRKDLVGFFQDVVGNKKLLVQFEYGQKKEISSSLLVILSSK